MIVRHDISRNYHRRTYYILSVILLEEHTRLSRVSLFQIKTYLMYHNVQPPSVRQRNGYPVTQKVSQGIINTEARGYRKPVSESPGSRSTPTLAIQRDDRTRYATDE